MRRTIPLISLAWLLGGLPGVAAAEQGVELKNKITPGMQLHLQRHEVSEQNITGTMFRKPITKSSDHHQELKITVLKQREDGGYDLRVDVVAVKADLTIPDKGRWVFDSSKPEEADTDVFISPSLRALVKTPVQVAVDELGMPLAVAGMESWIKVTHRDVASLFIEDHFEDVVRELILEDAPEGPVEVGDSWEEHEQEEWLGGLAQRVSDSVSALAGLEQRDGRTYANIVVETLLDAQPSKVADERGITLELVEPMINFEGMFDVELGHFAQASSEGSFTLVVHFPGQQDEEQPDKEPEMQEQRIKVSFSTEAELLGHKMLSADELKELHKGLPDIKRQVLKKALRERRAEQKAEAGPEPAEAEEEAPADEPEEQTPTEEAPAGEPDQQEEPG